MILPVIHVVHFSSIAAHDASRENGYQFLSLNSSAPQFFCAMPLYISPSMRGVSGHHEAVKLRESKPGLFDHQVNRAVDVAPAGYDALKRVIEVLPSPGLRVVAAAMLQE